MPTGKVKVVAGFARLRDDELDSKAQSILSSLTGNANYPTPTPDLASVEAALTAYRAAMAAAESGNATATAAKNEKRDILIAKLDELSLYVQLNCKNELSILLSSGFDAKKGRTPKGILAKPENLKIEVGPNKGSVKVSVNKVDGARSYVFEHRLASAAEGAWQLATGTARSTLLEALTSGAEYIFRVSVVGADPTRVYSDEVRSFVL